MKKKILISSCASIAMALWGAFHAPDLSGQVAPVYSIQSPEAASIGEYGAVPVGLFTGIPEISVPLYEISLGDKTFPIGLSYHLASVKPNSYPGSVGLGWSLQCGGVISRTVRGVYDEKASEDYQNGFYYHCSEMSDISSEDFKETTFSFTQSDSDEWYELSADEFSFNFFGYSGNFYLNPDGGWTVVSDQDIKVEFCSDTGFGSYSTLNRIPRIARWPNLSNNIRYFKEFTLVTPDGCRYTFGGTSAIDFSVPYYSRRNGDLIATAWHLSKIVTPSGREVRYTYTNDEKMVDIRYVPGKYTLTGTPSDLITPSVSQNIGRRGYSGYLLYPARISSIVTPNEEIEFDYRPDWRYNEVWAHCSGDALFWEDTGTKRHDIYMRGDEDPATQFSYLFSPFVFSSERVTRKDIANKLYAQVLYDIKFRSRTGGTDTSVFFSYLDDSRRKLAGIDWRSGCPELVTTYIEGGGVMYPFYSTPDELSDDDMPEYRFKYDEGRMPKGYVLPQTDRWGYYNGLSFSTADLFPGTADPPRNTAATKYETLKEIRYPTGGRTLFQYEGHKYSKIENQNHILENEYGIAGGLRIGSIINVTREDDTLSVRKYYYSEERGPSASSSGIARAANVLSISYNVGIVESYSALFGEKKDTVCVTMTERSLYGFGAPVTNLNSPDVGYSSVIEETLDKDGRSLGYVLYRFSNYDTDIYGNSHMDENAFSQYNAGNTQAGCPYTSNSAERGKLLSKSWYKDDGTLLREEKYKYRRINDGFLTTATQRVVNLNINQGNPYTAPMGWLTRTYTYRYLPESVVVHEGAYSDSTSMAYNSSLLLTSRAKTTSTGSQSIESYSYPSDHPQTYRWLVDAHILSPTITEETSADGMTRVITTTYGNAGSGGSVVPYIVKRDLSVDGGTPGTVGYEVLSTDGWGNPTEILENGEHSVLVWDSTGQRLLQRILNRTLLEETPQPSPRPSLTDYQEEIFLPEEFADLEPVTDAIAYTYKYDRNLRLKEMITPDGVSMCFAYDSLGRLVEEFYYEDTALGRQKRTVRKYEYHYCDEN